MNQIHDVFRHASEAIEPRGDIDRAIRSAQRRRAATGVGVPLAGAAMVAGIIAVGAQPWDSETDQEAPVAGGDVSTSALQNRAFAATDLSGVPVETLEVEFHSKRLSAFAGCNTASTASFEVSDDSLTVGKLVSTARACVETGTADDPDAWLSGFLSSDPQLELDGDTLIMRSDDATVTLTETVSAKRDLPGAGSPKDPVGSNVN